MSMDRTLYLNENRRITVYRDGPSVWIREEGRAGRRVPARLIGRVVVIGNVRLEAEVITLFTNNDIPVTLMNRAGDMAAVVVPYVENLPRYYEKQKALLASPDLVTRFKDWMRSQRRTVQLGVLRRLSRRAFESLSATGFTDDQYRRVIEEFKAVSAEQWEVVVRVIGLLFREFVVGYILKIGLDPHIGVFNRRRNFGLALDICHILQPEIEMQALQFARIAREKSYLVKEKASWAVTPEGMKDIVHRFENRREEIRAMTGTILDGIFELIRELKR